MHTHDLYTEELEKIILSLMDNAGPSRLTNYQTLILNTLDKRRIPDNTQAALPVLSEDA